MPQPSKIPLAFAASGDKNVIPESTETTGFASWREGFPAITSAPFSEGGIAPKRADFNGIFNALSAATVWNQQGGFYAYDNATDYEVGNVIEYNNDLYKCITANGPGSAVKAPTDTTVWSKVMTAADAAALYLPLSGGTLSGNLKFSQSGAYIQKTTDSGTMAIYSGSALNKGAELVLYGKDHGSQPGEFSLRAKNGVDTMILRGYPNGTLTWDGNKVITSAGGTLNGNLNFSTTSSYIEKTNTNGTLALYAGNNIDKGAEIVLYGKDYTSAPGEFQIRAKDGVHSAILRGYPDGKLKWESKDVADVATIQTGTWKPVLKGGTTAGAFTASASGKYIKLGDSVYIYGRIEITACTSVPSGNIMISGLPYVADGGTGARNMTILCRANGFDNNSAQKIYGLFVAGNTSNLIARVPSLSPTIGISMYSEGVWSTTNADTVAVKVTQGSYTGTQIIFAGWYLSK